MTREESANMESPEKTGLSDEISEISSNEKIGNVATLIVSALHLQFTVSNE